MNLAEKLEKVFQGLHRTKIETEVVFKIAFSPVTALGTILCTADCIIVEFCRLFERSQQTNQSNPKFFDLSRISNLVPSASFRHKKKVKFFLKVPLGTMLPNFELSKYRNTSKLEEIQKFRTGLLGHYRQSAKCRVHHS